MTSLATFVDRYTMRHVRLFPHPVSRVWKAITDDEQVGQWFGFPVSYDLRIGGVCAWGPPDNVFYETRISRLEPETILKHDNVPPGEDGYMLFELEQHADGCKFNFVQHFDPAGAFTENPDMAGGDLPGGPDTPWRPNFVGGFHSCFDQLGKLLDGGSLDPEHESPFVQEIIDQFVWRRKTYHGLSDEDADEYQRQLKGITRWNELNGIYREHIRTTIPKE